MSERQFEALMNELLDMRKRVEALELEVALMRSPVPDDASEMPTVLPT